MKSHTPGTWTQAPLAQTEILAADDTMIATARDGLNGITRDQAIANARLIAAAPDLLEALKPFIDFPADTLDDLEQNPNQPFTMTVLGLFMNNARAAIAKATGAA